MSRFSARLTALAMATAASLAAQAPRKLGAPTAKVEQDFTTIDGVFELKDGRVIVLDSRENVIHLIDLKTGAAKKLGREGDGPGEYRRPVEIWPSSGDSALIRDFARFGQLMVVTPQGELGGFVSMTDSTFSTRSFNPSFIDRAGRIYGLEYTPQGGAYDSARIVRWDRVKPARDTVARFRAQLAPAEPPNEKDIIRDRSGNAVGYRPAAVPRVFVPYNEWTAGPDGRVAIVRAAPYQVIYVSANGPRVSGPVIQYTTVTVTQAEKDEYLAEASKPGLSLSSRNGVISTQYVKRQPPTNVEWAEMLPPFATRSTRFASDGMLWVKRNVKAGAATTYDLFDQSGKLAMQLELPPGRKVVGFGNGAVYLARVDDDDLHYLERYALPGR